MFAITFENEMHHQWCSDYIFQEFEDAKEYLIDKGFIEKNRLFIRESYNWIVYEKAYIAPRKVW